MKLYLKTIWKLTSFVAVLLVLLMISSLIFQPKGNKASDGILDPVANGILGEPENTIDVLIVGDSEAYSAFIPLKIWKDKGITSYVCATPAQKLFYSLEFVEKTFRTQKPKIVFLETNALFRATTYVDGVAQKFEDKLTVFRYHNRWKTLKLRDFSFGTDVTGTELNKGYRFSNAIVPADSTDHMKKSSLPEKISNQNKLQIEAIKKLCDENGAKLVLISTPSTINWNKLRHDRTEAYSKELGVEYIDLNYDKSINIDWSKDTKDKGDHLNHNGALKVTEFLGGYLASTGLFTDKRSNTSYSDWFDAVEQFTKGTGNPL